MKNYSKLVLLQRKRLKTLFLKHTTVVNKYYKKNVLKKNIK